MENPSPTEEGVDQESIAAGPSGSDDDDSPIPVQEDNFSNPSTDDSGGPSTDESEVGGSKGLSVDQANLHSRFSRQRIHDPLPPHHGYRNVRRRLDPQISPATQFVHPGQHGTSLSPSPGPRPSSDPNLLLPPHGYRNVRRRLDPQLSPATQFVHPGQHGTSLSPSPSPSHSSDSWPSTFSDRQEGSTSSNTRAGPLTVVRTVPADSTTDDRSPYIESARIGTPTTSPAPPALQQDVSTSTLAIQAIHAGASYPPGNYYQRVMPQRPMPPYGAQFPPGYQHLHSFHRSNFPSGPRASIPVPHGPQYHPSGFPLHDQARGNTSTTPPVVRRGGSTASNSQPQNPPGGGRASRSRQTADAVPGLVRTIRGTITIPSPVPITDELARALGGKCPMCERELGDPAPGEDLQPGVFPATDSLPCEHVFHADCLKTITPEGSSNTPIPCPACPIDSDSSEASS